MPYPRGRKAQTRERIVEAARVRFNRHGYDRVTIDQIMEDAELTRGGFYAHFSCKEELFAEAVASFLDGRGARWRAEEGIDPRARQPVMAQRMVEAYLSRRHLDDRDGQCPLIAYATDVGRAGPQVRASYRRLLEAMVWLFESNLDGEVGGRRGRALSLAALCVGGMILARSLPETDIAEEVRLAAYEAAAGIWASEEPTI